MADAEDLATKVEQLRAALQEALDGWAYAAQYKGEHLAKKHGDFEDIERLRALLKGISTGSVDRLM